MERTTASIPDATASDGPRARDGAPPEAVAAGAGELTVRVAPRVANSAEWRAALAALFDALRPRFPEIDLSPRAAFRRREAATATELLLHYVDGGRRLAGAALLRTTPCVVQVLLICSAVRGTGSRLMDVIECHERWTQPYVVLRAVPSAVGFYLQRRFALFDYRQLQSNYVSGDVDAGLTAQLRDARWSEQSGGERSGGEQSGGERRAPCAQWARVRHALLLKGWTRADSDELPLLRHRRLLAPRRTRSTRLRERRERS